jgi:hypothetical protein
VDIKYHTFKYLIVERIKYRKIKSYLEIKENENTTCKTLAVEGR